MKCIRCGGEFKPMPRMTENSLLWGLCPECVWWKYGLEALSPDFLNECVISEILDWLKQK